MSTRNLQEGGTGLPRFDESRGKRHGFFVGRDAAFSLGHRETREGGSRASILLLTLSILLLDDFINASLLHYNIVIDKGDRSSRIYKLPSFSSIL